MSQNPEHSTVEPKTQANLQEVSEPLQTEQAQTNQAQMEQPQTELSQTSQPVENEPRDWSLGTVRWIFWSAMALHCLLWIVGPLLMFPNHALDTLEMMVVGQNWVIASYKHGALPSWVVDSVFRLTGSVDWAPYLAAQLATVVSVWGIWAFLSRCFSRRTAVLAAVATLGYFAFGLYNFKYDNLTILRPFWIYSTLFLLLAVEENRWWQWVLCGVCLAGGLSCHFLTGLLVVAIVVYMALDPVARKYWKTPGPYLSTVTCALLVQPLFIWILQHGCPQYTYASGKFELALGGPLTHIKYPLRFLGTQLLLCCTTLIPLLPLTGFHWHWNWKGLWSTPAQRIVTTLMFVPLAIELLLIAVSGSKLPNRLGCYFALFFTCGVFSVVICRKDETVYRRGVWLSFVNILLIFSFYVLGTLCVAPKTSRLFYPGKELAQCVEQAWKAQTDAPLLFVRGDNWPATCACAYIPERPRVWSTLWTDEETFRKTGGMLLWIEPADETHGRIYSLIDWYGEDCVYTEGQDVPTEWLAKFPNAKILPPVTLEHKTRFPMFPVRVGMAYVPPESSEK